MKKLRNKELITNAILFVFVPIIINIIIESLSNKSIFGGILKLVCDPCVFMCNALIIASTISVGALLGKFRYFWIVLSSVLWLTLGTLNYVIISNRVLPLTAYDIQLIDVLPVVIKKYLTPVALAMACLGIVVIILGICVLFFRTLESAGKKHNYKWSVIFFAVMSAVSFGSVKYAIFVGALETRFPELPKSYIKNGFVYSFMVGLLDNGVEEVDGYSRELMNSITEEFTPTDSSKVKTPNIIFVQVESFFDLNTMSNVKYSSNPVPNLTKLTKDNPSGLLTVPVIGAGTVNTEFEVNTGMRIADFGAGEYPYKTILQDTPCESIATNLKNYGYTSHFIHNYKGRFYDRNYVYANLGYDNFYSLEYMSGYDTNANGWAKDEILIRYINESLDSTEGSDLVMAVSVQGHGSYDVKSDYTKHITVTGCAEKSMKASYEYYGNQVYEMDKFIGELVKEMSNRKEETILVIYGDHLPSLELTNRDLKGRNIYQTDYVIWNNAGIKYTDENINTYEIASKILKSVNVHDGLINSCHQKYKDTKDYLFNLQALEYDTLYGNQYSCGGKNPYCATQMMKNRRGIKINKIEKKPHHENTYVISGDGFTQMCIVRVGYRLVLTEYVDEHTLEFSDDNVDNETPVSVWEKDGGDSEEYFIEW